MPGGRATPRVGVIPEAGPQPDAAASVASRRFIMVLALAAVVGLVASLASWAFLEAIHQIEVGVYYDGAPIWWPVPVLAVAGVIVALAIDRLPGGGGHIPARGLSTAPTLPNMLPGVVLAGMATVALGPVLGPEAPLIALGGGLGLLGVQMLRRETPPELGQVMVAAGTFAAVSLIFGSPLAAAVLLIEATGLGGPKLPLVLLPGLLAAGIGSLVSIGIGSFTGLSTSDYALGTLHLPSYARPNGAGFGWSIALALAVAAGAFLIGRAARGVEPVVSRWRLVTLPLAGMVIAGLAIAYDQITGKSFQEVLFSGQDDLIGLTSNAAAYSLGVLALLIACKGIAWSISLVGFRGGPTFPAMYLGSAAGIMASHLPGFALTPAVAVGMAAGITAVLRLPLSAVVLATLLTSQSGAGSTPLVIIGVVTAYVATAALPAPGKALRIGRPLKRPAAAGRGPLR
jgi:H+/Cl- antiporter ClcA